MRSSYTVKPASSMTRAASMISCIVVPWRMTRVTASNAASAVSWSFRKRGVGSAAAVEVHERAENRLELPAIREAEGAHQADALRAARLQVGDRLVDSAVLAPAHLGVARELARERPVVVPLHVHDL